MTQGDVVRKPATSERTDLIQQISRLNSEWFDISNLVDQIEIAVDRVDSESIPPIIQGMTDASSIAAQARDGRLSKFFIDWYTEEICIDFYTRTRLVEVKEYMSESISEFSLMSTALYRSLIRLGHEDAVGVVVENVPKLIDAAFFNDSDIIIAGKKLNDALSVIFDSCDSSWELTRAVEFYAWLSEQRKSPILSQGTLLTLKSYGDVPFEWIPLQGLVDPRY